MAASSRRTDEKVASRRGSGRHCRRASRARALSLSLQGIRQRIRNLKVDSTEESSAQRASKDGPSAAQRAGRPCC